MSMIVAPITWPSDGEEKTVVNPFTLDPKERVWIETEEVMISLTPFAPAEKTGRMFLLDTSIGQCRVALRRRAGLLKVGRTLELYVPGTSELAYPEEKVIKMMTGPLEPAIPRPPDWPKNGEDVSEVDPFDLAQVPEGSEIYLQVENGVSFVITAGSMICDRTRLAELDYRNKEGKFPIRLYKIYGKITTIESKESCAGEYHFCYPSGGVFNIATGITAIRIVRKK